MGKPEFDLIDRIARHPACRSGGIVQRGIGDDAAWLTFTRDPHVLITTDMLMEGVDFTWQTCTPRQAGRKALAVNLSDIAAMGGRAMVAFLSVSLPQQQGVDWAYELMAGTLDLAAEYGVQIAGGDTNSWAGPLVVNITLLGEPLCEQPILRSGAQAGDGIFVTGACGGSIAGKHLDFTPRLREVEHLLSIVRPTAMIDLSDGLAADLHHVLMASNVGAEVEAARVPMTQAAFALANGNRSPLDHALGDGEDFELLFTVPPTEVARLRANWQHPTPIHQIGIITTSRDVMLIQPDGTRMALPPLGWSHPFSA